MFSSLTVSLALAASIVAQSSPAVVCVAGQCLAGFSNTTIGTKLSASGVATSVLLLPGQYSASTNPQLLHSLLTSSSASLTPSPGFQNTSSVSLPLNVALQPGLVVYPQSLYSGQAAFAPLPSTPAINASQSLSAGSLSISSSVWAAFDVGSNNRVVIWDSVPDVSQLPSTSSGSFSLVDIESSACSPPCAGSGVCSASGTCTCAPGFTGASCESCSSGFFGPTCEPCPAGCSSCDDGISGSGRCRTSIVSNLPSSCNCLNGVCNSDGRCTCNAGFTTADNGTACAKCAPGFFLTSTGDCKVCGLGCTQCSDDDGICITCKTGLTQSSDDRTRCNAVASETCPSGGFSSGNSCVACSPLCQTCSGPTSNDCIICGAGRFSLNGACVPVDGNGVCANSKLIGDNVKHECDTCGAKCTSCTIPNFNVVSTVDQLRCTGCLPGFVLSQGKCVESCPSSTFLSSQDNVTCTACDSSCGTCFGAATFCLTCANNQLASNGKCVSTCPSNTFSSAGACLSCHPDCASCSGASFNQCSTCNPNRPVLTNGRCLPTCSKSQYFEKTSSTCQSCDSSCSSCSGAGPSNCLACSSPNQVLRRGVCAQATCNNSSSVVPGLGVCLSELVEVPSGTGTASTPLPTISGIATPITVRRPLEWWQILLMALGCAFIFLCVLVCWRRRARKKRAKRTAQFASAKALDRRPGWRWRLLRFGEKLFGHGASSRVPVNEESEEVKLMRLRDAEEARHYLEMKNLMGSSYKGGGSSKALASLHASRDSLGIHSSDDSSRLSTGSLYSQMTGVPRRTPEPRLPLKSSSDLRASRLSSSTMSSWTSKPRELTPTEAESYVQAMRGNTNRNPFRTS